MTQKNLDLVGIKVFYQKALSLLQNGEKDKAINVLYKDMPKDLYDKSLDILYNRNDKIANQSTRRLVCKVDKILNPTLIEDEEEVVKVAKDKDWYVDKYDY